MVRYTREDFDAVRKSELFDVAWYRARYQDVALLGIDEVEHFLEYGALLRRSPSPKFDTRYYLEAYPDVASDGINPLLHYLVRGAGEGRLPVRPAGELTLASIASAVDATFVPRYTGPPPQQIPVKTLCFYLPQFHPIAENDKWWGKGFTEWTNVRPAVPQFQGHYQPHVPIELGYYDLRDANAQRAQVELAKLYGIGGFCFYFYWFGGNRLLETPLQNYLDDKRLDLPFCLCWANENWSRRWDGLDSEILIAQSYSAQDDLDFISHVATYLRDPRYVRVAGKPLLLVYRPNLLPSAAATARRWRDWCRDNGIGEIHLAYTQSFEQCDPATYGFDSAVEFPPNNSNIPDVTDLVEPLADNFKAKVYDWRALVERSRSYAKPEYKLFRSVCPSWDNTARRKNAGSILVNSSPHLYQQWLTNALNDTVDRFEEPDERLVFINAWNEWAEGAHLEPDERYGYAYLDATRMALLRNGIVAGRSHRAEMGSESRGCVAVVIHAFYIDVFDELLAYIRDAGSEELCLYVSYPAENRAAVLARLQNQPRKYETLEVQNRGRDVLPFLKILPRVVAAGHNLVVKVHTKKSTHREDGERWRRELFDQLVSAGAISNARRHFKEHPSTGILGPQGHIVPMTYYFGSNAEKVICLARRLGMEAAVLSSTNFVAGTMFAARIEALLPLLALGLGEQDFEEEAGQVDGTMAHAVERALAVSARCVGLEVTTLDQQINTEYAFARQTLLGSA
jgi:lipopolysaccharide biosynthesis protein